ncbi:glycerol-3-phosphate ABC transporter ATP-binding protein [Secundilactobacillus paracollinoides]|uniref:Glycerol-3-phosphate ABC transporter ATP-binding protein n=1 Tax=Secundilactobacillus paracollinoides TaxID=240427 RepID=A0A1B2IY00_9LACO|nr:ABC transporter ATP-binding protein [Secundilactobacillus paracollinoides]ANZ64605.1 glycerol-3-phosphate ABC transporter ATP-binding protein [Secundilactobacillus paracollinoides]ANZ66890.1 glycerol-3-phosphate ABC transporter ATP-binding protein [Secundilactobacillus paracollinoides]
MAIELHDVTKTYEAGQQPVLSKVNMTVNDGEFFVIVGPSGCGKSTLLRMIAGLISISSGKLMINQQVANDIPPKDRKLSMVFQSYALFPFMSVYDNVAFGLKSRKLAPQEIQKRVNDALVMVDLKALATRKPRSLSGGQRQRVTLARAIASDAQFCLMDEPLSNLDAQLRAKMRLELKALQRQLGITVIYVTHDQVEAMTMADRVLVLQDHQVQQIDTPINIYEHPKNEFVATFFGTPQINLLSADYAHRELTVNKSFRLPIAYPLAAGQYTIGIRPSDVTVAVNDRQANARVSAVSYLGDQTVIVAELLESADELRLVVSNQADVKNGDFISLQRVNHFFVFDQHGALITAESREEVATHAATLV